MANDNKRLEEILRKAKLTAAQSAEVTDKAPKTPVESGLDLVKSVESIKQAADTVNATAKIATETTRATVAWLKPIAEGAWKVVGPFVRGYKAAWLKTDSKAYEGKFKKCLAKTGRGLLIAATAGVGIMLIPSGFGGDMVRAVTVEPIADAAITVKDATRMQLAYTEKQVFYLNRESQTSDGAKDGSYSVKATTEDQEHNFNFVIKPGFLHSQWYLNNRGSLLYNTDVIAAKIPSGEVAKCEATWYGSYHPFLLYIGAKPVLLDAKCEAFKGSFNSNAADSVKAAPAAAAQVTAPAAATARTPG